MFSVKAAKRTAVIEKDDQARTTTIDWTCDGLGRLTREKFDSYDNTLDFTADYRFDLASNRVVESGGTRRLPN